MKDPKQMLADDPTSLERALLSAVRLETPSLEHRARTLEALGISAPAAAPVAGAGSALAVKLALVSVLAAGAITAMVFSPPRGRGNLRSDAAPAQISVEAPSQALLPASDHAPLPIPSPPANQVGLQAPIPRPGQALLPVVAPAPALLPAPAGPASPPARAESNLMGQIPARVTPRNPPATTVGANSPAPSPNTPLTTPTTNPSTSNPPPSDVREQIELIDSARTAVARHDPTSALVTLGQYTARFPRGAFQEESAVLRIEALDQRGDRARAAVMARAFLAGNPKSTLVERVERIAGH